MAVYLLHIEPSIHHARHYAGYCADNRLAQRIAEHESGRGSRLCEVAHERGRELVLVRVWWGAGRDFERQLKDRHNGPAHCPLCNPKLYSMELPVICSEAYS